MKNSIWIATLFCFISINATAQNAILIKDALNKALQQSVLCERIFKNQLLNVSNFIDTENQKDLKNATTHFSSNLYELNAVAKNPETKIALENVSNLWAKFRKHIFKKPEANELAAILEEGIKLQNACKMVFVQIKSENDIKLDPFIFSSAQESLLAQRLAKLYFLYYWKVPYSNLDQELNEAIMQSESLMEKLVAVTENTPEINALLNKQVENWPKLRNYLLDKNDRLLLHYIFTKTNERHQDFDTINQLYYQLQGNQNR